MARVEAAIFDADGMLLDTREFIFGAYAYTLEAHGLPVPERGAIAAYMGRALRVCYEAFAPGYDYDGLKTVHQAFQEENMHLVRPYDGLHDMLDKLRGKVKLAVASSRYGNLLPTLSHAGILDYFEVVIQGNDVVNRKPAPDCLYKALGSMGVDAKKASMSGDTAEDIMAGKAAGMGVTIGITHGFGLEEELLGQNPDYIVHSLDVIPDILLGA
jgi:phosphoglycolate phosphatase